MNINRIKKLLALVLCMGAISMPVTAYAQSDMTPPTLTATLEGDTLVIESRDDNSGVEAVYVNGIRVRSLVDGKASVAVKDYAADSETIDLYAVDYAGNQSDTVSLDNPYYEVPAFAAETEEERTGSTEAVPFTPNGTGTVLDTASSEDHKQFYTITTEAGNVFYLVIDGDREENNVYFLNAVTEADLMALAEKDESSGTDVTSAPEVCTCMEKCEAGKVDTSCVLCKNDLNRCTGKAVQAEEPEETAEPAQTEKGTGDTGVIIFLVLGVLAVGGVGYYVKIVRPKQQEAEDEDEEEFEDEGYGEGFDPDSAFDRDLTFLDEGDIPDGDDE